MKSTETSDYKQTPITHAQTRSRHSASSRLVRVHDAKRGNDRLQRATAPLASHASQNCGDVEVAADGGRADGTDLHRLLKPLLWSFPSSYITCRASRPTLHTDPKRSHIITHYKLLSEQQEPIGAPPPSLEHASRWLRIICHASPSPSADQRRRSWPASRGASSPRACRAADGAPALRQAAYPRASLCCTGTVSA